jgi:tetratricopeptide (TPR) repeat protein
LFKELVRKLEKKVVVANGSSMNPYEILELAPGASADDIKAAYHRLAKKWHPDRFTGAEKAEAEQRFRELAEAFNMLKDAGRREELNRNLQPTPATTTQAETPVQQAPTSQAVPLCERTAEDWCKDAEEAFETGDHEKALGLIQYCIRLEPEKAEYFVFLAKVLDEGGGDKKALVKALESAIRLNPKDVDSTIRLAEVFQSVGMHARATRMWKTASSLAPNHKYFLAEQRKNGVKAKTTEKAGTMGEQFAVLKEQWTAMINRWLKRG